MTTKTIPLSIILSTLLLIAGCQNKAVEKAQFYIFGTLTDITLSGVEKNAAQDLFSEIQQDLQAMHNNWHPWEPGVLVDINRAFAAGSCAPFDKSLKVLIEASQQMERQTAGKFNAGIGGLIKLWGFHTSEYPIKSAPPAREAINALVNQQPSALSIFFEANSVCSSNPATQLDFGGIAKGYAVDLIVEKLQATGVDAAIVNAGGDLRAYSRVEQQFWRIAVRHPQQGLIGLIEVGQDEAVFTSGNYQRYVEHEDQRYAHILNPLTGWPVADLASVTVLSENGMQADAAATALMVAGLEGWHELVQQLGLDAVLVVDESGKLYMTKAMQSRLLLYEDDAKSEKKGNTDNDTVWDIEIVD